MSPVNLRTLTVTEASERTGMKREAILRLLASGNLAGNRIGKCWRVSEASLIAWVTATRTPSKPESNHETFSDAENPL